MVNLGGIAGGAGIPDCRCGSNAVVIKWFLCRAPLGMSSPRGSYSGLPEDKQKSRALGERGKLSEDVLKVVRHPAKADMCMLGRLIKIRKAESGLYRQFLQGVAQRPH